MMLGSLQLYIGPMGSGKTTAMRVSAKHEADAGSAVLFIGPSLDTRDELAYSTHSDLLSKESVGVSYLKVNKLSMANIDFYRWIFIDEGHMFNDLSETVYMWFAKGKHIVVSSLNGDIDLRLIGDIHKLLPIITEPPRLFTNRCRKCIAEGVDSKLAVAHFTILKGLDTRLGQYKVGGMDEYDAVCYHHRTYDV